MKALVESKAVLGLAAILIAITDAACSSNSHHEPCGTIPNTATIVMRNGQGSAAAQIVKVGGSVDVRRMSSLDTVTFQPAEGLSPFTVSRGADLSYVAENAGSYTVSEVDSAGRTLGAARLTVRRC